MARPVGLGGRKRNRSKLSDISPVESKTEGGFLSGEGHTGLTMEISAIGLAKKNETDDHSASSDLTLSAVGESFEESDLSKCSDDCDAEGEHKAKRTKRNVSFDLDADTAAFIPPMLVRPRLNTYLERIAEMSTFAEEKPLDQSDCSMEIHDESANESDSNQLLSSPGSGDQDVVVDLANKKSALCAGAPRRTPFRVIKKHLFSSPFSVAQVLALVPAENVRMGHSTRLGQAL